MNYLDQWRENWLPEMVHGDFEVSRFVIKEPSLRMFTHPDEFIPPGIYTRLIWQGKTWMSNTPFEYNSNRAFLLLAKGIVLIGGLGLGLLPRILCSKDTVESITVYEINQDLIDMMSPYLENSKLTIKRGDILQYRPEKQEVYDSIWFDIWPAVCTDNLVDISRLNRRWSRQHWTRIGPRKSWFEARLRQMKKTESKQNKCWI